MTIRAFNGVLLAAVFAASACAGLPTSPSSSTSTQQQDTITLTGWTLNACPIAATPLPGWRNCPGTVTLNVQKTITSGFISVYFNYPNNNAFYHGETAVNAKGTVTVNVVNDYVSQCVTTFATSFDVYDGRQSATNAVKIASIPRTLTPTCT